MNWFSKNKYAYQAVQIDLSEYVESLKTRLYDLVAFSELDYERLSQYTLDMNALLLALQEIKYPSIPQVIQAVNQKDINALSDAAWNIHQMAQETLKDRSKMFMYDKYRKARTILQDYAEYLDQDHLKSSRYTEQAAQADLQRLTLETQAKMQAIAQNIQQAISRIEGWSGTQVIVHAREIDRENNSFDPGDDALVELGSGDMSPNFTYFSQAEGNPDIDDILEAGDSDFFTNSSIQNDYFSLVKELRNPGSSSLSGKVLTLYTARPAKDRQTYMNVTSVPSNLFLTNRYDSAEGIAMDFGERDIWKVRIDSRYLITTLDSPTEKQYQVVGNGQVPVRSIELIHPYEPRR